MASQACPARARPYGKPLLGTTRKLTHDYISSECNRRSRRCAKFWPLRLRRPTRRTLFLSFRPLPQSSSPRRAYT